MHLSPRPLMHLSPRPLMHLSPRPLMYLLPPSSLFKLEFARFINLHVTFVAVCLLLIRILLV
jgi:hypothetical protein